MVRGESAGPALRRASLVDGWRLSTLAPDLDADFGRLASCGETSLDLRRSQSVALHEAVTTLLALGDTAGALADAERSRDIMLDLVRLAA